jgi:hypothetical protein
VDNPDYEVIKLTNKILQHEETIALLKGQIDAVYSSIGWKMLGRLRSMRNAVIPEAVYLRVRKCFLRDKQKETRD